MKDSSYLRHNIGVDISNSPHFRKMPGMSLQTPDGKVRLTEGNTYRPKGYPNMSDPATVGCLAITAFRLVREEINAAQKRAENSFPLFFKTDMADFESTMIQVPDSVKYVEVPKSVTHWNRFMAVSSIRGATSIQAVAALRDVYLEATI